MLNLPFEPPLEKILIPHIKQDGVQLFMKREDMLHPFVSGNKMRKLKYVLKHAGDEHKKTLVTFGGAWSNHLLAVACSGARYHFKTTGFVRGEEVRNPMLEMCRLFGMHLQFVSREKYADKESLFHAQFGKDKSALFIDEGGKGELAARGCEEIVEGISSDITHVVCAMGTGTTLAGIARGCARKNMHADGICILKGAEGIDTNISALTPGLKNITVHHRFHRGGYAKTDAELLSFIKSFASHTGILIDQVYTAKMVMGVIQLIGEGYYKPGDRIAMIHTGGLMGLLSQL